MEKWNQDDGQPLVCNVYILCAIEAGILNRLSLNSEGCQAGYNLVQAQKKYKEKDLGI
jgi:hypothetical protein